MFDRHHLLLYFNFTIIFLQKKKTKTLSSVLFHFYSVLEWPMAQIFWKYISSMNYPKI